MKKKVLFLLIIVSFAKTKGQDTIPFLDTCFAYPILQTYFPPVEEVPLDTLYHVNKEFGVVYGNPNNPLIVDQKYRIPFASTIYGIAVSGNSFDMPTGVKVKISTYDENNGYFYYDSICRENNLFVKQMLYDYNSICLLPVPVQVPYGAPAIAPCNIYLFNEKIQIHDTLFYISINNKNADYYCYYSGIMNDTVALSVATSPTSPSIGTSFWGIFFPILKLPCPAPRKVNVGTNYSGRVEFHWNPGGDTMLYQLAFHSADDGRLMFETDTLTDTTFTLVDSIAPAEMVNGRYEVRVRKACDYTGAPIANPLVWSDWSEPRTFNYMHRVEGIEDIESFGPQFTLSPNPAKGTVTVEGAAEVERVEIVDMEGRVVIGERPLAGSPSTVDISHLAPGVYLVRLSGPTGSATRKLVVE